MRNLISCKYASISTDAVAFSNAHFGAGSGTIHLQAVGCTGRETNLTDCLEVRSSLCLQGHSDDAGVRCQGLKSHYSKWRSYEQKRLFGAPGKVVIKTALV